MKATWLVLALSSLPLFAQTGPSSQVPAHSVVGSLTIDIADIQLPIAYGTTETRAQITVCSAQPVNRIQVQAYSNADPLSADAVSSTMMDVLPTKAAGGYCVTALAHAAMAQLTEVDATSTALARVAPAPAIAGSTAAAARQR